MNSGTYVDPKFPPTEEYNQSSYIPSATDYYHVSHQAQHYGYAVNSINNINGLNGLNGHQTSSMGYYGQHPGGYYSAPCGMTVTHSTPLGQQQHHQQQQQQLSSPGLIQRSPVPSPTPSLTSMAPCGPVQGHHVSPLLNHQHLQHQQHQHQFQLGPATPQQQQQLHGSVIAAQQNNCPTQTQIQQQQQLQQQQPQHQLCQPPTPNSPESDLDDGSDSDPEHNPVIYPWMKKIHVAGARKFLLANHL